MEGRLSRKEANRLLVECCEELCRELLPHGRVEGDWFIADGWRGDPLKTVRIHLKTGRWHVTEKRWVSPAPNRPQ